jgi:hypothetical protein
MTDSEFRLYSRKGGARAANFLRTLPLLHRAAGRDYLKGTRGLLDCRSLVAQNPNMGPRNPVLPTHRASVWRLSRLFRQSQKPGL